MKLCTEHTIRYALLVKIAYVGLYKPACDMNQNILKIPEKLIRFNYQVDVKASVFQELAVKYFKKNIDEELYQLYSDELKQFNKSYVDISANDSYDLFHENGKKLSLYKNKNYWVIPNGRILQQIILKYGLEKHLQSKNLRKLLVKYEFQKLYD